jgi:hypothetical protein
VLPKSISVYLPRSQASRTQEHLLRQINHVVLNHREQVARGAGKGDRFPAPCRPFKLLPAFAPGHQLFRSTCCVTLLARCCWTWRHALSVVIGLWWARGIEFDALIHASTEEIAKSLQGNWRAEHQFSLKQALDAFEFIGTQWAECDTQIEAQLQSLQSHDGEPAKGKKARACPQRAEVRSAHPALQDVRRGPYPHRWH